MDPMFIFIIVIVVGVFAVAIRMDLKRRRLHDTSSGGVMGKSRRQGTLDSREKGSRWGVGGGG